MNRFKQIMDDVRQRTRDNQPIREALDQVDMVIAPSTAGEAPADHGFRLPYSSEPPSIEELWHVANYDPAF